MLFSLFSPSLFTWLSQPDVGTPELDATVDDDPYYTEGAYCWNVVISKKFLRTRKIMVMHSNERGECRPRTLVDRKQKRYENAVDVVVRLHDPTDPSTERTTPLSSAHVQLGDVPRGVNRDGALPLLVGERSNFKKFPTHTQDHGDA